MRVVEAEGAVGVVEVAEALARRTVLVLGREREELRVPVARKLWKAVLLMRSQCTNN